MRNMDEIIHMDDWKHQPGPWKMIYTEEEIKRMMRRYAEECIREIWEYIPGHEDEEKNRETSGVFQEVLRDIAKEVII